MPVRIAATVVACALSAGVAACSNPQSPSAEAGFTTSVSVPLDAPLSHLHGLHVARRGKLLAGTHGGLFSIDVATGATARVGDSDDDFMGLGGASGTDELVSSGHPGPSSDAPNPLGLRASMDGGQTWTTRSRSGTTDFHVLATDGKTLLGSDGQGLQTSHDGGVTWAAGAEVAVAALAVTPSAVWAITSDGVARSTDGGGSFTTMPAVPPLALITGNSRGLWGVDAAGYAWSSADGAEWDKGERVGAVEALTSGPDGTGYAASSDAVYVLKRSDTGPR
ncbi:exo-alpha-sialidase [Mycobacterium hodleri]|uniref:Exo-alpha-sialidase n=1 Tax=Mycolicibacterium hodleri TaxID=49897 RepID=A0A502EE58_9MYCO|nr:exo-alpha-sialidase [Mycolicibacterium hodleri]